MIKPPSLRSSIIVGCRILVNGLGLRKGRKVFAVGYNKCATTSLHALFTSLGLPSHHGTGWRRCDNLWLLNTFDCFSDGVPHDLQKLDRLFPGAKFILQVRDLDSWVYSRLAHIERGKSRRGYTVNAEWDTTEHAVTQWILQRNSHHMFVQEYFSRRPDDLLIVNFLRDSKAGTRVANFLSFSGNYDRPADNANPEKGVPQGHRLLLSACAAALHVPNNELTYDIYCPSLIEQGTSFRFPFDTSAFVR